MDRPDFINCRKLAAQATKLDGSGRIREALPIYDRVVKMLSNLIRLNFLPQHQQKMILFRDNYTRRANAIRAELGQGQYGQGQRANVPRPAQPTRAPPPPPPYQPPVSPPKPTSPPRGSARRQLPSTPPGTKSASSPHSTPSAASSPSPTKHGDGATPTKSEPATPDLPSQASLEAQARNHGAPHSNRSSSSSSTSRSSGDGDPSQQNGSNPVGTLREYCTLEPGPDQKITCVDHMALRVGSQSFFGSFMLPTDRLQQAVRDIQSKQHKIQQFAAHLGVHPPTPPTSPQKTNGSARANSSMHNSARRGGSRINGEHQQPSPGQPPQDATAADMPQHPEQPHPPHNHHQHQQRRKGGSTAGQVTAPGVSVAADGRIAQAKEDHHQDTIVQRPDRPDSGVFYRQQAWQEHVRAAQKQVGPRQRPLHETVSLKERAETSRELKRVNPSSRDRGYSLDGLETECYIDENRTIDVVLPRSKEPRKLPEGATTSILFETAAVGAKIRNTHKMGGERVKEMDHFVASIETPRVQLQLPDIAVTVANMMSQGLQPITITDCTTHGSGGDSGSASIRLHVPSQFRSADDSSTTSSIVVQHARALYFIASTLVSRVLTFLRVEEIEFYYMPTMRADATVCMRSSHDHKLYLNVLVLQQQEGCSLNTSTPRPSRRVWRYWLQRLAMADNGDVKPAAFGANTDKDGAAASHGADGGGGGGGAAKQRSEPRIRPTGLYDRDVRQRFKQLAAELQLS